MFAECAVMAKARKVEERGTRQIRVNEDLGEMISWIIRIEGGSTATLLDPMIRAQIVARFTRYEGVVEKMRAAEAALQKAEEEARRVTRPEGEAEPAKPKRKRAELILVVSNGTRATCANSPCFLARSHALGAAPVP